MERTKAAAGLRLSRSATLKSADQTVLPPNGLVSGPTRFASFEPRDAVQPLTARLNIAVVAERVTAPTPMMVTSA